MKRFALIALVPFFTGCQSAGDLEQRTPDIRATSRLDTISAANCLVYNLNIQGRDKTGINKSISHRIDTLAIGEKYRVTHADTLTVATQTYMVDVFTLNGTTVLEGYTTRGFDSWVKPAIDACI